MESTAQPIPEQSEDVGISRKRKLLRIIIPCLVIMLSCVCVLLIVGSRIIKVDKQAGTIRIAEVYLTTGLDTQGKPMPAVDRFPPETPRIYCIVKVVAPKPVHVGIRWIYEDEVIFVDEGTFNGDYGFYISPLPGEQFREGNYRVEIFLIEETIKSADFTVGR